MKNRTNIRLRKKPVVVHDIHFRKPRTFSPFHVRVHRLFRRLYPLIRWGNAHRPFVAALLILVVAVGGFGFQKLSTQAAVATLYPSTCLGGWEHPGGAQGEPDAGDGYTRSNSAVLEKNSQAQLFCGGFVGELPTDATHQKVVVHLLWGYESIPPETPTAGSNSEPATTTVIIEHSFEESAAAILAIPEDTPAEVVAPIDVIPAETSEEPVPEPEPAPEPVSEPEPAAAEPEPSNEAEAPSEPSALLNLLLPTAHAQEATSTTPDDAIIEVLYTVDGEEWQVLGQVESIYHDHTFEIPLEAFSSIEDLSRVQIALHTLPSLTEREPIFLDTVWLEVEYGEGEEETILDGPLMEEAVAIVDVGLEKIPPPLVPTRVFTRQVQVDVGAEHRCEAESFLIDLSHQESAPARLNVRTVSGVSYELEIGGLPAGIDVRFTPSNEYVVALSSDQSAADLLVTKDNAAQAGDFTVPIIFTRLGEEESSTICQINIVNF